MTKMEKDAAAVTPELIEAKLREARRLRAEAMAEAFDFGLIARLKAAFARRRDAGAEKKARAATA